MIYLVGISIYTIHFVTIYKTFLLNFSIENPLHNCHISIFTNEIFLFPIVNNITR